MRKCAGPRAEWSTTTSTSRHSGATPDRSRDATSWFLLLGSCPLDRSGRSGDTIPVRIPARFSTRRDGRVVDGGGLENHCTRKGTGGSNPSPSDLRSPAFVRELWSASRSAFARLHSCASYGRQAATYTSSVTTLCAYLSERTLAAKPDRDNWRDNRGAARRSCQLSESMRDGDAQRVQSTDLERSGSFRRQRCQQLFGFTAGLFAMSQRSTLAPADFPSSSARRLEASGPGPPRANRESAETGALPWPVSAFLRACSVSLPGSLSQCLQDRIGGDDRGAGRSPRRPQPEPTQASRH
jgi:hypothetical protein